MKQEPLAGAKKLRPLLSLMPLLKPYWRQIGLASILLLLAAGQTLVLPGAARDAVDLGFMRDAGALNHYFLLLLFAVILLGITVACRYLLVIWIGERVVADLRQKLFAHLLTLDAHFYASAKAGELSSRLSGDAELIRSAFGASASVALRNFLLLTGGLSLMFYHQPKLTLIIIATFPPLAAVLFVFLRHIRKQSKIARDELAEAVSFASEITDASRTVQAENYSPLAYGKLTGRIASQFRATQKSIIYNAAFSFVTFSSISSAIILTLWLGANAVLEGSMTEGELFQFLFLAIFTSSSVAEIGQVFGELGRASGAATRLGEILATKPSITSEDEPLVLEKPVRGALQLKAVDFHYHGREDLPALSAINLDIKPGEKVGLVGPSGAGKSTLFNLLLRFYDPVRGTISLDGKPLRKLDLDALRGEIALVPQEPVIFAATLAENIRFAQEDASDEAVMAAAEAANALEFIEKLPDGMMTEVGPRGITLSGGQRQRIAIARALLRDAPVLLLDEATSALDVISEALVHEALERLMQGRTSLVIAHRLATVRKLDRILVLQEGRLIEDGPHEKLEKAGGLYAKLAELQFVQTGGKRPDVGL